MKYVDEVVMEEMGKEGEVILGELERVELMREGRKVVVYGNGGRGKRDIGRGLGIKGWEEEFRVLFS